MVGFSTAAGPLSSATGIYRGLAFSAEVCLLYIAQGAQVVGVRALVVEPDRASCDVLCTSLRCGRFRELQSGTGSTT